MARRKAKVPAPPWLDRWLTFWAAIACLIVLARHTLLREPEGLRDRVGHAILHRGRYRNHDLNAVVFLLLRLAALKMPTTTS